MLRLVIAAAVLSTAFIAGPAQAACLVEDSRPECSRAVGTNDISPFDRNEQRQLNEAIAAAEFENDKRENAFFKALGFRNTKIKDAKGDLAQAHADLEAAIEAYHNAANWRERREARRQIFRALYDKKRGLIALYKAKKIPVPVFPTLLAIPDDPSGGTGGFNSAVDTDTHNAANRSHPDVPGNSGKETW